MRKNGRVAVEKLFKVSKSGVGSPTLFKRLFPLLPTPLSEGEDF
jgi:hypothetical protein